MLFLDFWGSVGSAIIDALRSLMLSICEIVYKLIVFFFDIFMMLGNASILKDSTVQEIYGRIGLILGLFMIFRVTFSLIQYIINPDSMLDKQKGLFNIVKKIVIVVVLLGVTPSIFSFAFDIQKEIIASNIIPKVITGKNINTSNFGKDLAWYTFSSFFKYDSKAEDNATLRDQCIALSGNPSGLELDFRAGTNFRYAYNCVTEKVGINDNIQETYYLIDFDGNGIVAVIVGLVILWMIIMYVIQVGIRVVQLAYLQLIAPVPIIMYLTPKGEDTLNKWVKQCTTTYLDFFMRVAIIYLVVFIIELLIGNESKEYFIDSLGNTTGVDLTFITVIMIIALLIFAQRVPKLFKELFPSSGGAAKFDFGLNPKKVLNDTWAAGLIGGTVGAVGAGASNAIHGYMNMRKAWKTSDVSKKWSDMTKEERDAWKISNVNQEKWNSMSKEQKDKILNDPNAEKEYNSMRRKQMAARVGATAGAGVKGVASVAGGVVGGAKAGLKTKDITKSGEAIKTANANRENRELRTEAGYHWYNPLPAMEDKILEFSGDRTTDDVKNRQKAMVDAKKWQEQLSRGEQIFNYVGGDLADSNGVVKTGVFKHSEYIASWNEKNKAKGEVKSAESVVEQMQRAASAAYNDFSGTEEERQYRINVAEQRLSNAKKTLSAANGKLKIAEQQHERNQEIFKDDKEIEILFNYYADTHKEGKELNAGVSDIVIPSSMVVDNDVQDDDNNPIDLSSGNLGEIKASLAKNLQGLGEKVSDARKKEAENMGKGPYTPKTKESHDAVVELEKEMAATEEKIAEIDGMLNASAPEYTADDLDRETKKLKDLEKKNERLKDDGIEVKQQQNLVNRIKQYLNSNNNNNDNNS